MQGNFPKIQQNMQGIYGAPEIMLLKFYAVMKTSSIGLYSMNVPNRIKFSRKHFITPFCNSGVVNDRL
ncbi:MAG: hypothetical protein QXK15_00435 [Candidatus Bathyarchaeia archaeon]